MGGIFYLSVPIGVNRVEFNANRVFDPSVVFDLAGKNSLRLSSLTAIRLGGMVETIVPDEMQLSDLASQRYALGIFTFVKRTDA